MSNLILPDGKGGYEQEIQKIELPTIEVPRHLQDDLAANPTLEPAFYQAVAKALDRSLNDPRTRLREPTVRALKTRVELCYDAVVTMRNDLKWALKKCFDILPDALMEALLHGQRLDDQMAREGRDRFWKGPGGTTVERGQAVFDNADAQDQDINDDAVRAYAEASKSK